MKVLSSDFLCFKDQTLVILLLILRQEVREEVLQEKSTNRKVLDMLEHEVLDLQSENEDELLLVLGTIETSL